MPLRRCRRAALGRPQFRRKIGDVVALGRIDVMYAVNVLSRCRPAPRRGHLERVKRIYAFLKQYHKTAIKFNTEMPDYERLTVVEGNWGAQHHPCREDIPSNAPTPRGKPVMITTFVDANLMADITTGRSQTGTIHLLNKTPIYRVVLQTSELC